MDKIVLYPNCKINIGLRIVRKREDGYHDLETIFYPVYGLCDKLLVEKSEEFAFVQDGLALDCLPMDNLIYKVFNRMSQRYPQIGNVKITFKKNIPFGAGLGGGSSDAAHMAIALNELFALGLTREQLAEELCGLGADCPFFVYNTPCYAEGIGDKLTEVELDLSGMRLLMIKPECSVSTRDAYAGITPQGNSFLKEKLGDLRELLQIATNDFEETVFAVHPSLAVIKQRLIDAGAIYAAMSGSGSTIFGLFQGDAEGATMANLRLLHEEFASMIIFDDTLGQTKS